MPKNEEIRSFVLRTLKTFGAPAQEISEELVMAQVTVEHPPFIFGPPRLETVNLNLVFDPDHIPKYPGAELMISGSYRLNWMIEGLRKRGRITLGAVHYETNLRRWQREIQRLLPEDFPYFFFHKPVLLYRPFILANFIISNQTDERHDYAYSIGLDLVTGDYRPELHQDLHGYTVTQRLPAHGLREEAISIVDAVSACRDMAEAKASSYDQVWATEAKSRFEEELVFLQRYYESDMDEGFRARVEEIYSKFRPRTILRWINLAVLYLPEVNYTLQSLHGGTLPTAVYLPVGNRLQLIEETG